MTITAAERLDKRTFAGSADQPRYTRTFVVYSDPSTDTLTAEQALRRAGVPQPLDRHPDDSQMVVTGLPQVQQTPTT